MLMTVRRQLMAARGRAVKKALPSAVCVLLSVLGVVGCHSNRKPADTLEPKVSGETITIPINSPQIAALNVESAAARQAASMPLAGRLVWDENTTVRVFSPFAGIVRR